jgi:hypothetical protein
MRRTTLVATALVLGIGSAARAEVVLALYIGTSRTHSTEYRVWTRLSLWAEAKYDQGRLEIDVSPGSRVETRVRTLHAVAGVAWHL